MNGARYIMFHYLTFTFSKRREMSERIKLECTQCHSGIKTLSSFTRVSSQLPSLASVFSSLSSLLGSSSPDQLDIRTFLTVIHLHTARKPTCRCS